MSKRQIQTYSIFFFIGLFIISWSALMYVVGPAQMVSFIGVENSLLLMFTIALFGGLSTFTAPSFYTTLITLALGGVDPIILGVVTGAGMTISDSVFFYFGMKGRELLSLRWEEKAERLSNWFKKKPIWAPPLVVFLYTGFTPLPNDPLMVGTALANISYRRIAFFLLLGNTTLSTIVAVAASLGIQII